MILPTNIIINKNKPSATEKSSRYKINGIKDNTIII